MSFLFFKWLHILSSTVLLGTGMGIAYFMWRAQRSRDLRVIAAVTSYVVRADYIFTATAVVLQPLTGWLLMRELGLPFSTPWIRNSLLIYLVIGACWLPVVWLQIQMRDIAQAALANAAPLPAHYDRYFRRWLVLGAPAFAGVLLVFWWMIGKGAGF